MKRYNAKCRKLCNNTKNSQLESDFRYYKAYRNAVNCVKQHEIEIFYENWFQKIGKNSQLLWTVVNNIICKTSNRIDITEIEYQNRSYNNEKDICSIFNTHFAFAGKKVFDSIDQSNKVNPLNYVKRVTEALLFTPVNEQYITRIVMAMKSKMSSGYDDISNALLKRLVSVINVPMCIIFNKSL